MSEREEGSAGEIEVLVMGESGAGKSTLINYIFGMDMAKTGIGEAQTMEFTKYGPTDTLPDIALWDSRGMEMGKDELELILQRFIDKKTAIPFGSMGRLNVAWYVVPAPRARWTYADSEVVRGVLQHVATIIVLHKVDSAEEETVQKMREAIEGEGLPNVRAIINVCSHAPLSPSVCPQCGSEKLILRQRTNEWQCTECNEKGITSPFGHQELLSMTRALDQIQDCATLDHEEAELRVQKIVEDEIVYDEESVEEVRKILGCFRDDHSLCWWFWCCCCCLFFK